jgi:hypothetical protein
MTDECGTFGGMRIGRGSRSTWRKPALVPLCPSQNPHHLTWDRIWPAAVESWRYLTAWTTASSLHELTTWGSVLLEKSQWQKTEEGKEERKRKKQTKTMCFLSNKYWDKRIFKSTTPEISEMAFWRWKQAFSEILFYASGEIAHTWMNANKLENLCQRTLWGFPAARNMTVPC